jgi:hypothetical protein
VIIAYTELLGKLCTKYEITEMDDKDYEIMLKLIQWRDNDRRRPKTITDEYALIRQSNKMAISL